MYCAEVANFVSISSRRAPAADAKAYTVPYTHRVGGAPSGFAGSASLRLLSRQPAAARDRVVMVLNVMSISKKQMELPQIVLAAEEYVFPENGSGIS